MPTGAERRRGKGLSGQVRSLIRSAAIMTGRLEARVREDGYDTDERDIKQLTALAQACAKLAELEESPRDPARRDAGNPDELPQRFAEALQAFVDGRAAGLRRET